MHVIASLGDAPTTAIAAVAILLGLLFAARGPRDKRGATASDEAPAGPSLLTSVPVAAAPEPGPDVEPGFVGPEGTIVGHGTIRLGGGGLLGVSDPPPAADVPAWAAPPVEAPTPVVDADPPAPAEPAPPGQAAESAFPGQPEAPAEPAPAEPAWQRHMPKPAGFRHGGIKLGGKPVGRPPTD